MTHFFQCNDKRGPRPSRVCGHALLLRMASHLERVIPHLGHQKLACIMVAYAELCTLASNVLGKAFGAGGVATQRCQYDVIRHVLSNHLREASNRS